MITESDKIVIWLVGVSCAGKNREIPVPFQQQSHGMQGSARSMAI